MLLVYLLGCLLLKLSQASKGDRDPGFQSCLTECIHSACDEATQMPLILTLTFWDCRHDCRYTCMHQATRLAVAHKQPIQQFYGKWPFTRFLGLQEPASVIFSVLNGYSHYLGIRRYTHHVKHESYVLFHTMRLNGFAAINTWVWSTVYHSRDFGWTEKMDYFSAMLSILVNAYACVVRLFHLHPEYVKVSARGNTKNDSVKYKTSASQKVLIAVGLVFFICHVSYLSLWRFDYGYNMAASVAIAITTNILWIFWALRRIIVDKLQYPWKIIGVIVCITAAMSLEVFDFPPLWGVFDAHSLWHGSTVLLIPVLWDFNIDDALYETRKSKLV